MKNKGKEILRHLQTGVSYLIPLLTAAGLLTSIAVIFGGLSVWDETETFWGVLRMIGQTGLNFIVPMISAFIAYSIADRPGLAPGFVTGIIAYNMGTGFLGGMITGLLCGYLAQELKKIPIPARVQTLKVLFIIPIITTFVIGLLLWYVIGTPISMMTEGVSNWLNGLSGVNNAILAAVIGAMMAFDMGGPINKIAYAFGMAAFTDGNYAISTAMFIAIGLPPFGMFLATLLAPKLYSDSEKENAKSAIVMGIVGITEGTIPFAVADPLRVIPSIMIGTAISSSMNALFGITHATTMATFFAIPFVNNIPLYLVSIAAGGLATALIVNFLKGRSQKKEA